MKVNSGWGEDYQSDGMIHVCRGSDFTPTLLVLGHVCRDQIGTQLRLGGSASFAARAAACLGLRTALVTVAPPDFALLAPLQHNRNIALSYLPCAEETAFALDYSRAVRRIHLLNRAPDLHADLIPPRYLDAPVTYVAPVIGECRRSVLAALTSSHVVVGAQGWLRAVGECNLLVPAVADEFLDPPTNVTAVVFSEQDHPDAESLAAHLAGKAVLVALTRGRAGVTLLRGKQRLDIPAATANEVDPTGAGDVFGVVFAMALQRGADMVDAAQEAAFAAARVVEGPGLGNLQRARLQSALPPQFVPCP